MDTHANGAYVSRGNRRESAVHWLIVAFNLTRDAAEMALTTADYNGRHRHIAGFEVVAVPSRGFDRDGNPICLHLYDITG